MKILAAVDFSEVTQRMMTVLERMPCADAMEVVLLHVAAPEPDFVGYEAGPDVVRDQVAAELRREHDDLHALAQRLRAAGLATTAAMIPGATVDTILDQAGKRGADIIVIGSHGHGAVFDLLFGSVSEAVVRRTTLPTLVVPAQPRH